jgi:flagellar assembly factor FliW
MEGMWLMNIKTKYHGEVKINEEDIFTFENGLPGFEVEHSFALLPFPNNDLFSILQSTMTPSTGFVVSNPFGFFPSYDFNLDDNAKEQIDLHSEENVAVLVILTVNDSIEQSTANLQAPIIFNLKNKKAKQVILNDPRYKTKHLLNQAIQKAKG